MTPTNPHVGPAIFSILLAASDVCSMFFPVRLMASRLRLIILEFYEMLDKIEEFFFRFTLRVSTVLSTKRLLPQKSRLDWNRASKSLIEAFRSPRSSILRKSVFG